MDKKDPESAFLSVNVVSSTQELLIKKQETETEKIATPQRPVTKHKYNSTIVEVKD